MAEENNEPRDTTERNTIRYSAAGVPRFGTDRQSGGTSDTGNGTSHSRGTGTQSFRERIRSFSGNDTDEQSNDEPKRERKQRSDTGTTRSPRRRGTVKASPLGDLIAEGLGALTGIMAVSRGPHWNIPPEKLSRVGQAYGAVVDYYFPHEKIGEASLIGGAAIATASAFGPPLVIDMMRAQAEAMKRVAPQPQPQPAYTAPESPPFGYHPPPTPQPPPGSLFGMSEEELAAAMQFAAQMMQGMGMPDATATGE